MKKTFITTAVIVGITVLALIMFNKLISKKNKSAIFAEAEKGTFEITISTAGELIPEKSLDIFGPTLGVNPEQQQQQNRSQGGGGGGNRPLRSMWLRLRYPWSKRTASLYTAAFSASPYTAALRAGRKDAIHAGLGS